MAKIYITEHTEPSLYNGGMKSVVQMPPLATQTLTSSGASQQSAAFNAKTRMIQVHTDGIISLEFGSNPTVTTNSFRLAANTTVYFQVTPADKVAYITNT